MKFVKLSDDLKEYMKLNGYKTIAEKDTKKTGYVCPSCGSGTGPKGTGMTNSKTSEKYAYVMYRCWKCGWHGDIFDYVGEKFGLSGYYEKIAKTAEEMHIDIESENEKEEIRKALLLAKQKRKQQEKQEQQRKQKQLAHAKENNFYFYQCAHNNLISGQYKNALGYLYKRGINDEIIKQFKIGCQNDNSIVLPVTYDYWNERLLEGEYRYIVHDVDGVKPFRNYKYDDLNNYDIVLVTEGMFDAMIALKLNVFKKVLAIHGTQHKEAFYKVVNDCKHKNIIYVIQMDADDAGIKAQLEMCKTLDNKGIPCFDSFALSAIVKDLKECVKDLKKCKDTNECYLQNIKLTRKYFKKAYEFAETLREGLKEVQYNESKKEKTA